jgi:hypothetical protein
MYSQSELLTKAESSNFTSTSDYNDVMTFIKRLDNISEKIRIDTIAESVNGMSVPLMILGDPLPPEYGLNSDDSRIVIYIQANIHAGEVEGKEASLMFARDLLTGKDLSLLKDLVILICPNLNPEGNEKIDPLNRAYQNGPENGVGVRYNGQYLDMNRDGMKAESPEVRGVISNVFNKWDPALFMDCHTTNGSYHVEPVTFTWMTNPNGDNSLISYMERIMMPEIHNTLLKKYKIENCFYGEFVDMMDFNKGWLYEAAEPRYLTNYYGLRNRLAILNENYVYADYESRVKGCYYLIRSVAEYCAANRAAIKKMLKSVDEKTILRGLNPSPGDSFAIEFKVRALSEKVTIKTFEAEPDNNSDVWPPFRKTERQVTVSVPYLIDYYPVKSIRFPFAYLITVNSPEVNSLLKLQGIIIEKLACKSKFEVERFEISELKGASRSNQGHYTNSVKGRYLRESKEFPSGTFVIRTAQPLANLAAYLLEPQSGDGLLTWNYFDRYIVPQWGTGYNTYPVYRVVDPADMKTISAQ